MPGCPSTAQSRVSAALRLLPFSGEICEEAGGLCVEGEPEGGLAGPAYSPAATRTALGMRPSPAGAPPVDLSPPPNTLLLWLPLGEHLQTPRGGRMCWANSQNLPEPPPGCSVITGFPRSASHLRSASSRAAAAGAGPAWGQAIPCLLRAGAFRRCCLGRCRPPGPDGGTPGGGFSLAWR